MHSVFRIHDIKPLDENHRLFQANLTLITDNDKDLRLLMECIREETFLDAPGWYRLGELLRKMGHPAKAQQVYEVMLEQTTCEGKKASIYSLLGMIKADQGEYKEALILHKKAVEIVENTLPSNHSSLAVVYNNIGIAYGATGGNSKALSFFEKALAIEQQSLPPNHHGLASSYGNIGNVYNSIGDFSKARLFHKRAVDIGQRSLPQNHPDLQTYRKDLDTIKKKF